MTSLSPEQIVAKREAEAIKPKRVQFEAEHIAAEAALLAEGIDSNVSPSTLLLAESTPRVTEEYISNLSRANLNGLELTVAEKEYHQEYASREEAALKPLLRKGLATGALVGVGLGTFFTVSVGQAKYDIRTANDWMPANVEGQILPHNVLTADEIPLADGSVRIINPLSLSYGELSSTSKTDIVEKTVEASTIPAMAANPYAENLTLTGEELNIDKAIAKDLLQDIKDQNGTITSIKVEGIASDDYKGALGVRDPEQIALAQERADTGVGALRQTAAELSVQLPDEISVSAKEAVVSEEQAESIKKQAELEGKSLQEVLDAYNKGETVNPELKSSLNSVISRGVDYKVSYKTETTSTNYNLEKSQSNDSVSPLGVFGFVGGLSGVAAAAYSSVYRAFNAKRAIRKSAKRDLEKARKNSQ